MSGSPTPRPVSPRRWWLLLLVPVALAVGAIALNNKGDSEGDPPAPPPQEGPPLTLPVTTAELHAWPRIVRVHGSLIGDEHAVVGTQEAGVVKEVKVDLGSVVKKDDVLVILDPRKFDLRVNLAEATLAQARAKLGLPNDPNVKPDRTKTPLVRQELSTLEAARARRARARLLLERQALSAEEMEVENTAVSVAEARYQAALNAADESIANLATLRSELELAQESQADAVIRAPFEGIIDHRHVAPGVSVQFGDAVVTLVRIDPLRFHATVPEREAQNVAVGQEVRIEIEGRPVIEARISRIPPALNLTSRSLVIEADVPNPGHKVRAGLFAEARIVVDESARTLAVPVGAVIEFAGVEKVWVVRDGQAYEQPIRTGRRARQAVEVLEGLKPGDTIALDARQARAGRVVAVPRPVDLRVVAE